MVQHAHVKCLPACLHDDFMGRCSVVQLHAANPIVCVAVQAIKLLASQAFRTVHTCTLCKYLDLLLLLLLKPSIVQNFLGKPDTKQLSAYHSSVQHYAVPCSYAS